METFKVFRETAMPGTFVPYAIYFIAPAGDAAHVEVVVTDAAGTGSRHVINKSEIQSMIDSSMASAGASDLLIVADITARDALTPSKNVYAYVTDATGDSTVKSGGATYLYDFANTNWIKTNEAESMDVVLAWANITGRPDSAVADIDDAVIKRHTHSNKTQLDLLGDAGGLLTYNGNQVKTTWSSTGW